MTNCSLQPKRSPKSKEHGQRQAAARQTRLDLTRPDLHLGHMWCWNPPVSGSGHTGDLLVGDFTSLIGDPSGRNDTRPPLERASRSSRTPRPITRKPAGCWTWLRTEIRYNSEWGPVGAAGMIKLAARFTVARMMEREISPSASRTACRSPIHEFLYPLMVATTRRAARRHRTWRHGTRKFNLLVGRTLQSQYGQEQCILTMPLWSGLDGVEKMSKSKDNYIGLTEPGERNFRSGHVDQR